MKILAETLQEASITDPSEYRPEKQKEEYRNYIDSKSVEQIRRVYKEIHTEQTVDFVDSMVRKWCQFNHAEMSMIEACFLLDNLVDESDPDVDFPNSFHAFQTAEKAKQLHPDKDWFICTAFLHDLGKVMALFGEKQFAVVGDTFPVGCPPRHSIVFGINSFSDNPDISHPIYGRKHTGMYETHCGLENVKMSWGHDEYMYRVLVNNGHRLPDEALAIIRYHSFYPWHHSGDYMDLCTDKDLHNLFWIKEFNQCDLYSKSPIMPDVASLTPYYIDLLNKFVPGVYKW